MRKYLRAIARANMEREGVKRINKRRYMVNPRTGMVEKMPSFFAENWRKYAAR